MLPRHATRASLLYAEISACQRCEGLPLGPKPIFQLDPMAKILIAGQAPGEKAHHAGRPFADASGKRLRQWLGMSDEEFYCAQHLAILPMGLCFPGKAASGDKPPRKECAATWHAKVLASLPNIALRLVIGRHALDYYLPHARGSLADIIRHQFEVASNLLVLPHPSPRNNIWLAKHPWFEADVIPELQQKVRALLAE